VSPWFSALNMAMRAIITMPPFSAAEIRHSMATCQCWRSASAGGNASSALFARSLDLTDNPARPNPAAELESARAHYFDALVEAKTNTTAAPGKEAGSSNLALARTRYNDARQALGLEPIN